ncbi:MAG: KUP/HAK/KT family potassium transporter [Saprospiraceae bacterium]
MTHSQSKHSNWTIGGLLIALGIVFGDIGTSPLYVIQAIVGDRLVSKELLYGGVSCVFWTLLIVSTIKYVYLALNADNKGEGGIFALYARVRRYNQKLVIYPAMIGCATLIADGFITPPVSISSAVEGIHVLYPSLSINTIPIVIGIIILLFMFQQVGTKVVGMAFGPIMTIWFVMLGILGFKEILLYPSILKAINPMYAVDLLTRYPKGFWLLGSVFLCTTGAEALYSDLGHCGKMNIRISWTLVWVMLLLNYFGQSAWTLNHLEGNLIGENQRIFYSLMPEWFLPAGLVIATLAAIIASQALISGVFTLVNEAMKLKLWLKMKVNYPSDWKGQIYIPGINWMLMIGCLVVVFIFKTSSKMEAAYGMAIIIDMMMTSLLLGFFYRIQTHQFLLPFIGTVFLLGIEIVFLIANLDKFMHGGYFTFIIAFFITSIVFILYFANRIRHRLARFVPLNDYKEIIDKLNDDTTIAKEASHLVYLALTESDRKIDTNIIHSILKKKPKRADVYWFVHIETTDEPYTRTYHVDTVVPREMFFIKLKLGFKVEQTTNSMFFKIVKDMAANGEVDIKSPYAALKDLDQMGDFKFIITHNRVAVDSELSDFERWIVRSYRLIKRFSLSAIEDYGLETANVQEEQIPIYVGTKKEVLLTREED